MIVDHQDGNMAFDLTSHDNIRMLLTEYLEVAASKRLAFLQTTREQEVSNDYHCSYVVLTLYCLCYLLVESGTRCCR